MNMATGNYTGDGAATQAIAGVGFQPQFVIIYKATAAAFDEDYGFKTTDMLLNSNILQAVAAWGYLADYIISLDADGFTVGDGSTFVNILNINLQSYSYIAFTSV